MITKLLYPFWNKTEHRLRILWRLFLQGFLIALFSILSTLAITLSFQLFSGISPFSSTLPSASSARFESLVALSTLVVILLSVWISGKLFDRRRFADFGFHFNKSWWIDFGFGFLLGAVLMVCIFTVELVAGWVTITATFTTLDQSIPFSTGVFETLVLFISVGIYEETASRGYQLRNLAEGLNLPGIPTRVSVIIAWVISSMIFGFLHAGNPNSSIISTLNITLAGLFLGLGFILTGELAIPIGLHISWNFFQGNVFGFPVSGTTPFVKFISVLQGGPYLLTGGSFGPEAGILGLTAILVGSYLIVKWLQCRRGKVELQEWLAVYTTKSDQLN